MKKLLYTCVMGVMLAACQAKDTKKDAENAKKDSSEKKAVTEDKKVEESKEILKKDSVKAETPKKNEGVKVTKETQSETP